MAMDFLQSTAYSHNVLGDHWNRESRARDKHAADGNLVCGVYGNSRTKYRPRLGLSGTLQATPNPCLERNRHMKCDEVGRVALPELVPRTTKPDLDLNVDVPPHQVHHHHFGWTRAGARPVATEYSARRPWGIGLRYSEEVPPFWRQVDKPPLSMRTCQLQSSSGEKRSRSCAYPRLDKEGGCYSHMNSLGQLSTRVPTITEAGSIDS